MAPFVGFGATLGLGEETTWGTEVARTNWMEVLGFNVRRVIDRRPVERLGQVGDTSRMRSSHYDASDQVDWSLDIVGAYDDSTIMLCKHLLGAVATTGAGSPYTHTVTLGSVTQGLSLEFIHGNGLAEVVEGATPMSGTISISNGDYMRVSLTGIGETSGGFEAAGTPTYSTGGNEVLYSQAGQATFNSVPYDLIDLSIAVNSNLTARRLLANKFPKQPVGEGYREIVLTATVEYDASTLYAAFIADTESDFAITFTGSGVNALTITGQNAYIRSVTKPISGPGIIRQTIELVCQTDGTDLGFKMAFVNANASAVAN